MSYTMPPKYQRYANRLRELIEEGRNTIRFAPKSRSIVVTNENEIKIKVWVTKVETILRNVFGENSSHMSQYSRLLTPYSPSIREMYQVAGTIGVIEAALDDLENGFLLSQEFLVAADVFDSVLEQAKHLLDVKYKDPAAVLGRVVIEDSLKRLARANGISIVDANGKDKKASVINDELKTATIYNQPQWRQIQAWLDIGNDAAHGNFGNFSDDDVKRMLEGIEAFLATYLSVV